MLDDTCQENFTNITEHMAPKFLLKEAGFMLRFGSHRLDPESLNASVQKLIASQGYLSTHIFGLRPVYSVVPFFTQLHLRTQ